MNEETPPTRDQVDSSGSFILTHLVVLRELDISLPFSVRDDLHFLFINYTMYAHIMLAMSCESKYRVLNSA